MRRTIIPAAAALFALAVAAPTLAQPASDRAWTQLDDLRVVTAPYHDLQAALDAGFTPFSVDGGTTPTCFDHMGMGGMGVHYVRHIDDVTDPMDPEAMVYEVVDPDHLRLVAVEYIVPKEDVEDAQGNVVNLPHAFGQDFHKHPTLPVYVLHAWIWDTNPAGTFADFNPNVGPCPAAASPSPSEAAGTGHHVAFAGP
jgi:hypothetical protein